MIERLRIRQTDWSASPATGAPFKYKLDGRTSPELFLPIELFRNLLTGLSNPDGLAALTEAYGATAARLELPPDLLTQVLTVADDYMKRDARIQTLNRQLSTGAAGSGTELAAERDSLSRLQCAALFGALAQARQRYGRARFDRYLYEAVAPGMVVLTTAPDSADELMWWEGGCK